MNSMLSLGLDPTDVDLRYYFGKPEDLKEVLGRFDALWVRGGNCFVLRRAFRHSGADKIIKEMLERDEIVYAGYSAAVDMLMPSLHGSELVDNPLLVPEGYEPEVIWTGMGLIPYAVAPHYKSDHPESADVDKMVNYYIDHHMLFKSLRDGEAIVVDSNRHEVVG